VKHALLRIGAVGVVSSLTAAVSWVGRLILVGDLGVAFPSVSQATVSAARPERAVPPRAERYRDAEPLPDGRPNVPDGDGRTDSAAACAHHVSVSAGAATWDRRL